MLSWPFELVVDGTVVRAKPGLADESIASIVGMRRVPHDDIELLVGKVRREIVPATDEVDVRPGILIHARQVVGGLDAAPHLALVVAGIDDVRILDRMQSEQISQRCGSD
jgi:hypothetical protein